MPKSGRCMIWRRYPANGRRVADLGLVQVFTMHVFNLARRCPRKAWAEHDVLGSNRRSGRSM
jgi:hypothetical protein